MVLIDLAWNFKKWFTLSIWAWAPSITVCICHSTILFYYWVLSTDDFQRIPIWLKYLAAISELNSLKYVCKIQNSNVIMSL